MSGSLDTPANARFSSGAPFKLPDNAATKALQKGMVLCFKKEIPQAIEVLEKAMRQFTQQQSFLGMVFTQIELAWLYNINQERGRCERAFKDVELMLEQHDSTSGMNEMRARYLHYRGLQRYHEGEYGAAMKLFKQAQTFADPNGLETAKVYDSLGVHYERTGDFHRAVRYLKASLHIKTRIQEPIHEEAITCQILGRLHLLYEDYDLAFRHLQRSLQICCELKDEKRRASLKNELIRLFLRCEKETEAVRLIDENLKECETRHLRIQHAMTCFYQAYVFYRHQEFDRARQHLDRLAMSVFEKSRYKKGLAVGKRLQAWIQFALDPSDTAAPVALIGQAIELFRWENMIDEVAKSHFELGKLYHEIGNEKLALASLLDTLKIAEANGLFYLTPYIEDEIFRTHESKWEEIVNKRTKHERIFEQSRSLVDTLSELLESEHATATEFVKQNGNSIPVLVSLLRVGQAMAAERDLDKLLQLIREETEKALQADRCTVFLYDADTNELWSRVASGLDETEEIRFGANHGLAGYVVKSGEVLNVQNAYEDPRFNPDVDRQTGYKTTSMLCVPMRNRKGDIIGVFQVLNKKQNAAFLSTDEELLMAIASSAGIALENAQLYREMKMTFESFVITLSSTIDARDPITAGHSERVKEYAVLIGDKMHLNSGEMETLKYAALLHDIGKIGVKEEILVKEGRLTENEYRHIQEHVVYTHEILKNIRFEKHLMAIPDIAAAHHEKMDGSGYYRGLKGDAIPMGGRILAVADVFDAITSRRQYRARMPFNRVMRLLAEEADTHFDRNVVETLMDTELRDLSRILCMDRHLEIPDDEVRRVLKNIPDDLTIREYLDFLEKSRLSKQEGLIHRYFDTLYHFTEISDLD